VQTGFDSQKRRSRCTRKNTLPLDQILPQIVVVVDELADLMMVAGKDIEVRRSSAWRRWRVQRVSTIITATQRPSVDVITGVDQGELADAHLLPGDVQDRQSYHSW
jgi:S-DNA-T family DNA segregation ATPase FtsK/SpoIIIE